MIYEIMKLMASMYIFIPIMITIAYAYGGKKQVLKTTYYGVIGAVMSILLKIAFNIHRANCSVECFDAFSFPSGHTMVSLMMALSFIETPSFLLTISLSIIVMSFRVISGAHTVNEILGSIGFSYALFEIIKTIEGKKEFISKKTKESVRQLVHLTIGMCLFILISLFGRQIGAIISTSILIAISLYISIRSKIELNSIEDIEKRIERTTYIFGFGAIALISSILMITISIVNYRLMAFSILSLTISDVVSTIVGKNGSHKLLWNTKKTAEGLFGFIISSLCIGLILGINITTTTILSIIYGLVESIDYEDNISLGILSILFAILGKRFNIKI